MEGPRHQFGLGVACSVRLIPFSDVGEFKLRLVEDVCDNAGMEPRFETAHSPTCLGPVRKALFLIRVLDSWSASCMAQHTLGFSSPLPQTTVAPVFSELFSSTSLLFGSPPCSFSFPSPYSSPVKKNPF
ncbi:hypothetical protein TNCV_1087621 [Trichonephila clavipes]|nr:hypothetical protein TNCV_1087621 [Trichonephila clavipes]